jgi:hypothetical protein
MPLDGVAPQLPRELLTGGGGCCPCPTLPARPPAAPAHYRDSTHPSLPRVVAGGEERGGGRSEGRALSPAPSGCCFAGRRRRPALGPAQELTKDRRAQHLRRHHQFLGRANPPPPSAHRRVRIGTRRTRTRTRTHTMSCVCDEPEGVDERSGGVACECRLLRERTLSHVPSFSLRSATVDGLSWPK